ncbi:GNS1/SUR4 family-domain-containing protein [Pavlovales sp. CCMP2436]|nr:GNS1/SUR4 family-domain-containing protein [Pavlovales sp. CCMP2436]
MSLTAGLQAMGTLLLNGPNGAWTMRSVTEWMGSHYEVPFALVATYLVAIFVGTKLMADRAPFDLKVPLAAWNFFLSLGSITGFVFAGKLAVDAAHTRGPHVLACDNAIWWGNPSVMLFCLSKVPELVDTGFIVLRKKPLHFLHYYHHATVLLFCWDAWVVNNAVGGTANFAQEHHQHPIGPDGCWLLAVHLQHVLLQPHAAQQHVRLGDVRVLFRAIPQLLGEPIRPRAKSQGQEQLRRCIGNSRAY